MKIYLLIPLFIFMIHPMPAQGQTHAPTDQLSPYEQQVYGERLWQVPREPYQREYRSEEYQARPYLTPTEKLKPGASILRDRASDRRPLRTAPPAVLGRPSRTQERFQSRKRFENEQRKISERSRVQVPGAAQPQPWQRERR